MTATTSRISRTAFGFALVAALAGATALAQAQETAWARVISATPSPESTGNIGYTVTYEYGGRQYTTRMDSRPGSHIPVQASAYGVTTRPVQPQARLAPAPLDQAGDDEDDDYQPQHAAPWAYARPEPGVVVSGGAPVYAAPPPVYVRPAPVYVAPPVYVQPGYGYAYPPVGISLNLGYSRGWGGGRWHGGHRGHRGW